MSKTKKSTNPKRVNTNSSVSLSKTKRIYQKSKKKIINETNIMNDNTDDNKANDISILSMLYDKLMSIFR